MQPLQYDLRDPAGAKDNSITNAATARSNLDALHTALNVRPTKKH